MITTLLLVVLCVAATGFYAGVETGAYRLNRIRLREWVERGSRTGLMLKSSVNDMERFVCMTLAGTNIAVYLATMLVTAMLQPLFTTHLTAEIISTIILAPLLLVFAEVVPKSIFQVFSDSLMRWLSPLLWLSNKALWPVSTLLLGVVALWRTILGGRAVAHQTVVTAQYLSTLLAAGTQDGVITPQQDSMVRNIMQLGSRPVRRIAVPLSDVAMLPIGATPEETRRAIARYDHERFPVYHGVHENIVGVLHVLDYLCAGQSGHLQPFLRKPVFIKADLTLDAAFRQLQESGQTMAVVADKDGHAVGIVTADDLLRAVFSTMRTSY